MAMKQLPSAFPPGVNTAQQIEPWRRMDWQKLWLATQRRKAWKALALVPAGPGAPPDFTLQVAVSLARTGMSHLGVPIRVADGTKVTLPHLIQFTEAVNRIVELGDLVLIALAATSENPVTISVAQSASGALLCVMLRNMSTADAKKTVEEIGAQRFIGSVAVRDKPQK